MHTHAVPKNDPVTRVCLLALWGSLPAALLLVSAQVASVWLLIPDARLSRLALILGAPLPVCSVIAGIALRRASPLVLLAGFVTSLGLMFVGQGFFAHLRMPTCDVLLHYSSGGVLLECLGIACLVGAIAMRERFVTRLCIAAACHAAISWFILHGFFRFTYSGSCAEHTFWHWPFALFPGGMVTMASVLPRVLLYVRSP